MVLVVRTDLNMRTGKIAAQCAHASLGMYMHLCSRKQQAQLDPWLEQGQAKVVVKCKDLSEMEEIERAAQIRGVPTYAIHDAGRTQVQAGSQTVLAVGPAPVSQIDSITGKLKLL